MHDISDNDEDKLIATILNLRPDKRTDLLSQVNSSLVANEMLVKKADKKAHRTETLALLLFLTALITSIANLMDHENWLIIISLLSFAFGIFAAIANGKATKQITYLTSQFAPDEQVDSVFAKLQIADRAEATQDEGEKTLFEQLRLYLAFAFCVDQAQRVQAAVDSTDDLGVLAQGLDKLQKMNMEKSGKYLSLEERLKQKLVDLISDLRQSMRPFVMQLVMAIIKRGDVELLPEKVQQQVGNNFADKLISDTDANADE